MVDVGVESAPGTGSTFWFSLRLEKADAARDSSADVRRVLEGVRVLVVDDNKTNRIILEQNLKTWGARSQSFNRGRTALAGMLAAAAAGDPFRLAILDYHMPEMDGIELAKADTARAHPHYRTAAADVHVTPRRYHGRP